MKNNKNNINVPTKMLWDYENRKILIAFVLWIFFGIMFFVIYRISKPLMIRWWNHLPLEVRGILMVLPFVIIIYTIFITWCDHEWGYRRER
jgi:uncharacterized membrane protein YbhN (UPF0104 family)